MLFFAWLALFLAIFPCAFAPICNTLSSPSALGLLTYAVTTSMTSDNLSSIYPLHLSFQQAPPQVTSVAYSPDNPHIFRHFKPAHRNLRVEPSVFAKDNLFFSHPVKASSPMLPVSRSTARILVSRYQTVFKPIRMLNIALLTLVLFEILLVSMTRSLQLQDSLPLVCYTGDLLLQFSRVQVARAVYFYNQLYYAICGDTRDMAAQLQTMEILLAQATTRCQQAEERTTVAERENTRLRSEIATYQLTLIDKGASHREISQLKSKVQDAHNAKHALVLEITRLNKHVKVLEEDLANERNAKHHAFILAVKHEAKLQRVCDERAKLVNGYEEYITELDASRDSAFNEIANMRKKLWGAENNNESAVERCEALEAEAIVNRSDIASLEYEIESIKAEVGELRKDKVALKASLAKAKATKAQLLTRVKAMKGESQMSSPSSTIRLQAQETKHTKASIQVERTAPFSRAAPSLSNKHRKAGHRSTYRHLISRTLAPKDKHSQAKSPSQPVTLRSASSTPESTVFGSTTSRDTCFGEGQTFEQQRSTSTGKLSKFFSIGKRTKLQTSILN